MPDRNLIEAVEEVFRTERPVNAIPAEAIPALCAQLAAHRDVLRRAGHQDGADRAEAVLEELAQLYSAKS
ncbi:hypothetical protein HQ346_10500 [Rhodococcus sp. BP-252]|nr:MULTISPECIES: hypothetical protein [Rhodococcus]MBY6412284.1 hypothetical protein [Rhodococcus sp. BP-320]MBY6416864.1 hypothetical protein [Rhodococcus sp. BP-321]MBY6421598.1 hypothetical protein [Rhodococcus sp. BP-324]MBY6426864.1 hypothetical protein [Rhodococcus sp. BP-323]MBY6432030.1 hypothetical protein [Rhodococcus sp. BP-322]